MKIFILSPHIDDAAYGLTLSISQFLNSGIDVTIINCFTVTQWTIRFVSKEQEVISKLSGRASIHSSRASGRLGHLLREWNELDQAAQYVQQAILGPAGMKDSCFIIPPAEAERVAVVYRDAANEPAAMASPRPGEPYPFLLRSSRAR